MFYKDFLPVRGCLFILFIVSSTDQTWVALMKFNLSRFSFIDHAFGFLSKNGLANTRSPRFPPYVIF